MKNENTEKEKVVQTFFANFAKYSKGHYFTLDRCKNVKFCDIVDLSKKFETSSQKKGVFFIKTFDKYHARAEKMTGKDKVAISTTCLS